MSTFLPHDSNDNPIPVMRLKNDGAHAITAITSTSARNASAFNENTRVISLYSNTDIFVRFGDSSVTASNTEHFFPAGLYYDFSIGSDENGKRTHIAPIAASDNGTVYISEKE